MAQNQNSDLYKGAFTFGLVHSFNLTTVVGSFPDISNSTVVQTTHMSAPRFTFDIGMTSDLYLNKNLSIQFDAVYTFSGAHFTNSKTVYNEIGKAETSEWFTYATSYFKFPIALVLYPNENIYLSGGGYIAPLLSSRRYNYWYDFNSQPLTNVAKVDYGIIFGMGFNFSFVKVGFQYSYGLSNMMSEDQFDLHHSDFQIIARWKFMSDIRNRQRNL